jgi:hypothetical protein
MPEVIGGLPNKIYVTAHFDYASSSPWLGETAQVGIRLAVCPTISAPLMGELFTLPMASSVDSVSVPRGHGHRRGKPSGARLDQGMSTT